MPEPRPAALPPGERTVGQLVAESIRFYGDHFWVVLPLGLPLAVVDLINIGHRTAFQVAVLWLAAPLFCAAYLRASQLVLEVRPTRAAAIVALLVFLPFPALVLVYILPGIAWFGLLGLAVPAAMAESLGVRDGLRRGLQLSRAELVHAIGGITTFSLVYLVSKGALLVLLHTQGSQTERIAVGLADVVLSPLIFLGAVFLYVDQAVRAKVK
ncbi:MAG TPA: hypothetical protein VLE97_01460 [Gaiellaceae bacterium]|nr:hypothetical protein [Gaiellaceae bacterium]